MKRNLDFLVIFLGLLIGPIGLYSDDHGCVQKDVTVLFETSDGVYIKEYYDQILSSSKKREQLKFVFAEFLTYFTGSKRVSIKKDLHAHKLLEAFKIIIIEREKKIEFIPELVSVMKSLVYFGGTLEYAEELLAMTQVDVGYTKEYVEKWAGTKEEQIDFNNKLQKWLDFYEGVIRRKAVEER